MRNDRNGLTRRLLQLILLVSLVVLTVGIVVRGAVQKTTLDRAWDSLRSQIVFRIQASCLNAVWELDENSLQSILRAEMLNEAILAIRVTLDGGTGDFWVSRSAGGTVSKAITPAATTDHRDFDLEWMPGTPNARKLAEVTVWFNNSGPETEYWSDIGWNMLLVASIVAALTLSLLWVVYRRLLQPLETMRGGMRLSASASSIGIPPQPIRQSLDSKAFPELGRMADDLDQVFQQIGEAIAVKRETEDKLNAVNQNLDYLVRERTSELASANESLNQALETVRKAQDEMVSSAQMVVLGRLVASIAHEINSPMGALISANTTVLNGLHDLSVAGWKSLKALTPEDMEWVRKILAEPRRGGSLTGQQERAQRLIYEKLLTGLSISEPMTFAQNLIDSEGTWDESSVRSLLATPNPDLILENAVRLRTLVNASQIIELASLRVAKFVQALRTYVRKDDETAIADVDLEESLETVLVLFQHQFKLGIDVRRDFQKVPQVRCRPDEIQQVWANLISNANHAMDYRGTLTLGLRSVDGGVCVSIADTGRGISPDHLAKIFEPFFSTKKPGEGTGLGLDISRKIVENAGGTLSVESRPGRTVFEVVLPVFVA